MAPLGDTWQWNGTNWSVVSGAGNPAARTGHRVTYDSNKKVIVMFGGCTSGCGGGGGGALVNDTYTLDGGAWSLWPPSPVSWPTARCCMGLAYFAGNVKRVIMFGGQDNLTTGLPDMWKWNSVNKSWTCILSCPP